MRDPCTSPCTNGARNISVVHGSGMLVPKIKLNSLIPVVWGVQIMKTIYDRYFNSKALDFCEQYAIFDVHKDMSIKSAEMVQTGVMTVWCLPTLCLATDSSSGGFCSFALQATLVQFMVEDWKRPITEGIAGRQRTICDMRQLFKFTAERLNEVNELHKVQDEADTRMLLHAKHFDADYDSII